jgi:hypothetical protein
LLLRGQVRFGRDLGFGGAEYVYMPCHAIPFHIMNESMYVCMVRAFSACCGWVSCVREWVEQGRRVNKKAVFFCPFLRGAVASQRCGDWVGDDDDETQSHAPNPMVWLSNPFSVWSFRSSRENDLRKCSWKRSEEALWKRSPRGRESFRVLSFRRNGGIR